MEVGGRGEKLMGTALILGGEVTKCSRIDSDKDHTTENVLKTTELYTLNG